MTDRDAILAVVDGVIVELENREQARWDEANRAARVIDDAVMALILRAAMPMHLSPLCRLVRLSWYVIDLEAGRVDLQDYDTRTVGRLERHVVLLQLEYAQTELTDKHIRFDADYLGKRTEFRFPQNWSFVGRSGM